MIATMFSGPGLLAGAGLSGAPRRARGVLARYVRSNRSTSVAGAAPCSSICPPRVSGGCPPGVSRFWDTYLAMGDRTPGPRGARRGCSSRELAAISVSRRFPAVFIFARGSRRRRPCSSSPQALRRSCGVAPSTSPRDGSRRWAVAATPRKSPSDGGRRTAPVVAAIGPPKARPLLVAWPRSTVASGNNARGSRHVRRVNVAAPVFSSHLAVAEHAASTMALRPVVRQRFRAQRFGEPQPCKSSRSAATGGAQNGARAATRPCESPEAQHFCQAAAAQQRNRSACAAPASGRTKTRTVARVQRGGVSGGTCLTPRRCSSKQRGHTSTPSTPSGRSCEAHNNAHAQLGAANYRSWSCASCASYLDF